MDKKDKIKLGITAVLAVILILVLAKAGKTVNKVKVSGANLPYDVLYPSGEKGELSEGLYRRLEEESKDFKLARDPFNQYEIITKDVSNSGSSLQGIIWDEKSPRAVINGKIVGPGDRVEDKVVLEIFPDRVVLSNGRENFQLRIGR